MPTIEDARFDYRARIEARKKAKELRPEHLVRVVKAHKDECLQSTSQLRDAWSNDWRIYQGDVDFSDKEDWQSQVWTPLSWAAIEHATATTQRALLDSPEFFGINGMEERSKVLADFFFKPIIQLCFNKANLVPKFTDSIKMALAIGMSQYLKFRMPSFAVPTLAGVHLTEDGRVEPVYSRTRRQMLTVEAVEPWKCYRDPHSKAREQWSGTYFIHEDTVDRSYITSGKEGGFFNKEAADSMLASGGTSHGTREDGTGPEEEAKRKGMEYYPSEFRKPYQIMEWYGDVPDENGDLIFPDGMMQVGDEKHLLYGVDDNPLWAVDIASGRRKWPFVGFTALGHPTRFEGFGILRGVNPLVIQYNNLSNLFSDGLNWIVNASSELDRTLLEDWNDLENFPGKLWIKTGGGRAITPAEIGKMSVAEVLAGLQHFLQQIENNDFVTNFMMGQAGAHKVTGKEVQIRIAQGMGVFEGMAKNIELGGVAAVELAHDFIVQYMTDFSDSPVQQIVGPMASKLLMSMDPATRMNELDGNFNYLFTGISAALQKAELLGRIMQAATLAASGPYSGYTNPHDFIKTVIDLMGIRDRITVYDKPMISLEAAKKIAMDMVAQATGQGGPRKRGGPGGTPPNVPDGRAIRVPPPSIAQLAPAPNEMSTAVAT